MCHTPGSAPAARTWIRTSPLPGTGRPMSWSRSTPASPYLSCAMAFTSCLLFGSVGIVEDVVERHREHTGDPEGHLQRWRIPAQLDRDDGLPGHADAFREIGLGHLAVGEPQRPDGVGDLGRLHHCGKLFRYAMILVTAPRTAERKKHR